MTNNPALTDASDELEARSWLYNHIGRLTGTIIGLIAFGFLAFIAALGSQAALGLLLVLVFGMFFIFVGGRLRGGR